MSVYENILASQIDNYHKRGNRSIVIDTKAMKKEAQRQLDLLDSRIDVNAPVYSLTVGDKQIIQIARALSQGGKILLFDEPTSSLSDHEVAKLMEVIRKLRDQGYIIFYISHFLDEIQDICDNVVVLRDGQLIGEANINEINKEKLVGMMLGRQVEGSIHTHNRVLDEVIFKAENVSGVKLPRDFSFELH